MAYLEAAFGARGHDCSHRLDMADAHSIPPSRPGERRGAKVAGVTGRGRAQAARCSGGLESMSQAGGRKAWAGNSVSSTPRRNSADATSYAAQKSR